MTDPVQEYHDSADVLAARYDQLSAEEVHAVFVDLLPASTERLALDIGAGSGHNAG